MPLLLYSDIFDRIRALAKWFYAIETRQTDAGSADLPLRYIESELSTPFTAQNKESQIASLDNSILSLINSYTGFKSTLLGYFSTILEEVGRALGIARYTSPQDVLSALVVAMIAETPDETVKTRTMAVDAGDVLAANLIKPHSGNIGNGKFVYTFEQAGPLTPNEIAVAGITHCECISSTTPGRELFQLKGEATQSAASYLLPGPGIGSAIAVSLNSPLLNGDFENWTGTAPAEAADNWTAVVGTWGTDIFKESSTVYRGDASLKGEHNVLNWQITQPLTLLPNTTYAVGLWIRDEGGTSTGDLYIEVVDAKLVQVIATELHLTLATDISATWAFKFFIFTTTGVSTSGWKLSIRVVSQAVEAIFIDAIQLAEMSQFNGINFALFAGSTDFVVGDKFGYGGTAHPGFEVETSSEGVLQKFFGRIYDVQLPSAGSPTQADPV